MDRKIVTIMMTSFMLILCVLTMTTLSVANMKRSQDQVVERASSSVLSTDGEISSDGSVTVRGSDLISSLVGITQIDNNIPEEKDKVYQYQENGIYQPVYAFELEGTQKSKSDIVADIDPTADYSLTYIFGNKTTTSTVTVQISKVS